MVKNTRQGIEKFLEKEGFKEIKAKKNPLNGIKRLLNRQIMRKIEIKSIWARENAR